MKLKLTKQEAGELAVKLMQEGAHWGPTTVQVMHKAYGFDDDAMLWAGTTFFGGISGHQDGVCGAVSGVGIALGLRYRDTSGNKDKEQKARETAINKTKEIVRQFKEKYGTINCIKLVGLDFSDPESAKRYFNDPEKLNLCFSYVRFAVEKMVELDERPEE